MISKDFVFGEHWLSEYGMIMCDPDEAQQFVSRNIDKAEITSLRATPNHYSTTYADALQLNFFIIKEEAVCESQEKAILSGDDIHFQKVCLTVWEHQWDLQYQSQF